MQIFSLAIAAALLVVVPARAGETAWQEVAPGVSMRLISAGTVTPDGIALIGMEIDMPADTKTYWRVPGETGLPMILDFSGSRGVVGHEVVWPFPTRDQQGGYLDYVYYGPTVLPIALRLDRPDGRAVVSAMLGICSDICVPAQARFDLDLGDGAPDGPNGLRLRQALAMAPIAWDGGQEPLGEVDFLPDQRAIGVRVTHPDLDIASLIATTESGAPLFGAPQKSPQQDLVLLPILEKTENTALEGQEIQLTFMTGMGAYELSRTIGAAAE